MMLVEETTVPQAALPVAVFKEHLHLGSGFADDGLQDAVLETYLRAALAAVEARTGKILIERDFSWTLSAWRDHVEQALPVAPVSAIADLRIAGRDGIETSVSGQAYQLIPDSQRPRIAATGGALPTVPPGGSARVLFMAGYGPDWGDLPADLAQAVLMLAAHYYEFRHDMRGTGGAMPQGVAALIDRYRTVRLFAGGRG